MGSLIKLLPLLLMAYIGYGLYMGYEEELQKVVQAEGGIPPIRSKIKKLKSSIKKSKSVQDQIEVFRKRIGEVTSQIETVQKQLPEVLLDTDILDTFTKQANILNIKNATFTPGKAKENGFFISKQYQMKAIGTHLQFLVFFERVKLLSRLYNIEAMTIETPKEPQRGRFTMINLTAYLEAYRYNPRHVEDSKSVEREVEKQLKATEDRKRKELQKAAKKKRRKKKGKRKKKR